MKIFIAIHHYPPNFTGGAELRAHRTALALQKRGHTVQAFAIERIDEKAANPILWVDEVFEGVPIRRIRFNAAAAPDWFIYSYNNPWIGEHLRQFLGQVQPDLFHLFGGYLQSGSALRAAMGLGIPTIVSLTDYWAICSQIQFVNRDFQVCRHVFDPACCVQCHFEQKRRYLWLRRVFPGLMRAYWKTQRHHMLRFSQRRDFLVETLNLVNTIIAPSRFIGEIHAQNGVQPQRIVCSRQGRSFPGLAGGPVPKTSSPTLRLAYIGQLAEIKGVHVLVEAMRRLPPQAGVSLQIYGDSTRFPRYIQRLRKIAGRDPRIQWMGLFQPEELSRVFSQIDVVVVPSLWYENSPNVILEAFAHQTPVIASNLGAMPELVRDAQCGLLFQTGNAKDLAATIQRLAADPALLARLAAGIEPVKTEDEELDQLEAIYRQVLQAGPTAGQQV